MPKSSFGETLRREREMRGVALQEIATATRISTRFLAALENEQWERLPGGVFNRGFIRAVARFLGLDEESLIAEYALATDDRPEVAVWATAQERPPRRRGLAWAVALFLVGLAASGWVGYRYVMPQIEAWRASPQVSAQDAGVPPPRAAPPTPVPVTVPPAPAATEPETLELKVEAGKATRLSVAADGKTLFDETLKPGEIRRFQAKEQFELSAADSSAVLLELNGQTVPPLGPPGEPGRATLTRKDLKKPQGGNP